MINVVIADDEEKICRLIMALGDWDSMGMTVTGTVSNGIEALELLGQKPADILITDIRMPGINGIKLIEKVSKISPSTRIIIVSGYAEFEYAQSAVRYGVSDYLLKPINKSQLNEALSKLAGEISGARQQADAMDRARLRTDADEQTIRSAVISDLLIDPSRELTEAALRDKYRFNTKGGAYRIICVKLDDAAAAVRREASAAEGADAAQRDFFWNKVMSVMNSSLKDICDDIIMLTQSRYLYALISYPAKREEDLIKAVRSCLSQTVSLRGILRKEEAAYALGSVAADAADISASLSSAKKAIKDRLTKGNLRVLEADPSQGALYDKKLLDHYAKVVTHALETIDEEELLREIEELKTRTGSISGVRGFEIYELARQIGSMLLMRLDLQDKNDRLKAFTTDCDNCGGIDALFAVTSDFVGCLMKELKAMREDSSVRPIRQAKKYLQNHYSQQISLEAISEELGLTPTYFSSLFKKETGTGFARYLSNLRIEAAKELLRDSNLSVEKICCRVGYSDVRHFNKIFEQSAGVKPAVYRKLYG